MAEVTERLMRRVMKIEEPENNSLLQVAWVSSARYHLGKGCVDISFDPQLKPYLVQLKNQFTSIELRYAIHLQSVYAMRIYELLKQYRKIGERVLPIAELREMLGIEAHKYPSTISGVSSSILRNARSTVRPTSALTILSSNRGGRSPTSAL